MERRRFLADYEIEAEEKEELLKRYKEDVFRFQMEQLTKACPCGILEISSPADGEETELIVYPVFEKHAISLKAGGLIRKNR